MVTDTELVALAREAATRSYSPFSHYRVGAVAVGADGSVHPGTNVENSAYGSAICAEGSAITRAVSAGVRKIDTIAVSCPDGTEPGYPCGNCRQLMFEFDVDRVVIDTPDGPRVHTLAELLPHGFKLKG
jgi:cytidine deaminase